MPPDRRERRRDVAEMLIADIPAGGLAVHGEHGEIARLELGGEIAAVNTPKPFIHPLRTPGGVTITGFAPDDHPWHHGLQFAMPRVDEHNLWGGGTYLSPEQGYQVLDNQGRIDHLAWTERRDGESAVIGQTLRWVGNDGRALLDEERAWSFAVAEVDGVAALIIDFESALRSATGEAVSLATPAQAGREDGGYGGLFLRLAEDFGADAIVGDESDLSESGGDSRTMTVHGRTGEQVPVTLGFSFRGEPATGDRRWLHRFEPFSAVGWASLYESGLDVPATGALRFRHRLLVADGHLSPEAVRSAL